jgi:hypothetical protein
MLISVLAVQGVHPAKNGRTLANLLNLWLVLAVAAGRTFFETAATEPDRGALMLYLFLLASLAGLGAALPASII